MFAADSPPDQPLPAHVDRVRTVAETDEGSTALAPGSAPTADADPRAPPRATTETTGIGISPGAGVSPPTDGSPSVTDTTQP